jgi:hypothetical protein
VSECRTDSEGLIGRDNRAAGARTLIGVRCFPQLTRTGCALHAANARHPIPSATENALRIFIFTPLPLGPDFIAPELAAHRANRDKRGGSPLACVVARLAAQGIPSGRLAIREPANELSATA